MLPSENYFSLFLMLSFKIPPAHKIFMMNIIKLTIAAGMFFCLFACNSAPEQKEAENKTEVAAVATDSTDKYRVVYKGDSGPGAGKKIVFMASDHEYRSEEGLPALARILAKRYGFTCTVLWGLDSAGYILPGSSDLKGTKALDDADLLVIFTRFSHFSDEEMEHIDAYLKRGGNVVGLRTATHAFNIKGESKWKHYDYDYKGDMKEWNLGFGKLVLGETWVSHYGENHKQSSRLILEKSQASHPILTGVSNVWVQSGGYTADPEKMGATVLAKGEVLNGMTAESPADKTKKLLPVAWVREYQLPGGKKGQAFATTHGASEDLLNEGFRRMLLNACLWGTGLESAIKADNTIELVGPYKPTPFNFDGYKDKVKPADLAGFESLIMPGEIVKPKPKQ